MIELGTACTSTEWLVDLKMLALAAGRPREARAGLVFFCWAVFKRALAGLCLSHNIECGSSQGHFAVAKAECPFQARLIGLVPAGLASPPCRPPLPTLNQGDAMNAARAFGPVTLHFTALHRTSGSLHNPGNPLSRWAKPPRFTQGGARPA